MEIERKYVIDGLDKLPENYEEYPACAIEQGYLCTAPVVRVRREGENYYLTYKGKGLLAREEVNLPLTREAYQHLIAKADGIVLRKKRIRIPLAKGYGSMWAGEDMGLVIEVDIFEGEYEGLVLAEVEFPSVEEAERFIPPAWFGRDVTFSGEYQNNRLSAGKAGGGISLPY